MTPEARKRYVDLVQRHSEWMQEYSKLLGELERRDSSHDLPPPVIPFGGTIYIEQRCAFAGEGEDGYLQLLSLPGQRAVGLRELRDFTNAAESLIVIDPYIFAGQKAAAARIADDFMRSARVGGKWLKRIHFVHDPAHTAIAIKRRMKQLLHNAGVALTEAQTTEVHDRVWIADRQRAIVVGTSLNGLGERAAFLLPLPEYDLKALLEFLDANALSRAER